MSEESQSRPPLEGEDDLLEMIWQTNNEESHQQIEMQQTPSIQSSSRRKSERVRSTPRPFSPDKIGAKKSRGEKRLVKSRRHLSSHRGKSYKCAEYRTEDKLPNGLPFSCDLCKSPYIVAREKSHQKRPKCPPSPRYKVDPGSGKTLQLCNACGLTFDRPVKPKRDPQVPNKEEKDAYIQNAKLFAWKWNVKFNDTSGVSLYCPEYRKKPCACIQTYITSADNPNESTPRAEHLIKLWKEAKDLSLLKYYPPDQLKQPRRKRNIGLGNGMRKSKEFEAFIIEKRIHLRDTLKLCERATQKILCYSNNFIHKKLKSEQGNCRAERQIGKAALGLLIPLGGLEKNTCCTDGCVRMAATHLTLLTEWRSRAQEGQGEARRVLAEMLTPSGGSRPNCYTFISMVTGRSLSLIGSVNEQMRRTGGNRQPPVHGMKKYWLKNRKNQGKASMQDMETRDSLNQVLGDSNAVPSTSNDGQLICEIATSQGNNGSTAEQFAMQRQQLFQLKQQLAEQQSQIQQHQQIVQQQLQQQFLLQHLTESGTTSQIVTGVNQIFGGGESGQQQFFISTNPQPDTNQTTSVVQIHPMVQNANATFTPLQTIPSSQIATHQQLTSPVLFQTQNIPQISLLQSPSQIQGGTGSFFTEAQSSPAANPQVSQLTPERLHTTNQETTFQTQNPYHAQFEEHGANQIVPQTQTAPKEASQTRQSFHSQNMPQVGFQAYCPHRTRLNAHDHHETTVVPSSLLQKQTANAVLNQASSTTLRVLVPVQTSLQSHQEVDLSNQKASYLSASSSEPTLTLASTQQQSSVQPTGGSIQLNYGTVSQETSSQGQQKPKVTQESSGQFLKEIPVTPIRVVVRVPMQSNSRSAAMSYQPITSSSATNNQSQSPNRTQALQTTPQFNPHQMSNLDGSVSCQVVQTAPPLTDINPNVIIAESRTSPIRNSAQPLLLQGEELIQALEENINLQIRDAPSGDLVQHRPKTIQQSQKFGCQHQSFFTLSDDTAANKTQTDHNYSVRPVSLLYSGSVPMLADSSSVNGLSKSPDSILAQPSTNIIAQPLAQPSGNILAQSSANILAQPSTNILAQLMGNTQSQAPTIPTLLNSAGLGVTLFQIPTTSGVQSYVQTAATNNSDQFDSTAYGHSSLMTLTSQTSLQEPVTDFSGFSSLGVTNIVSPGSEPITLEGRIRSDFTQISN